MGVGVGYAVLDNISTLQYSDQCFKFIAANDDTIRKKCFLLIYI